MRILLLADVHSNWPALRSIEEDYDVCICLGDLVDYGLEPIPCIEWMQAHAQHVVRGNHDHGVAQNVTIRGKAGFKYLTGITRPLNRQQLSLEHLRYLARLPVSKRITLDDTRFYLVHGTPRDPLDEHAPANVDYWRRRLERVDADVICVGHTHQQYVLEVDGKLVINPGSVGQPRDEDPRMGYAILENRRVELKRVEYPVEEMVRTIEESEVPEPAKSQLVDVYRNGGRLRRPSNGAVQ